MTRRRAVLVATTIVAATLLLSACGAAAPDADSTAAPTGAAPESPTPTPTVSSSEAPTAEPTCETIIPATTVEDFSEIGWTAKAESFRVGSIELAGGVSCTWGDFSVATDHVQLFGWAPLDQTQTDDAIEELLASGWRREDGDGGVYVTESPDTAIATDADGYGITYFFSAGTVEMADTKQGLLLVEWPPV